MALKDVLDSVGVSWSNDARDSNEGFEAKAKACNAFGTQRLQYPLIKEYTLNHIRDPAIV